MYQDSAMSEHGRAVNVNTSERIGSIATGITLLVSGLRRGGIGGIATGALGGYLVYRGATGHCELYSMLGKKNLPNDTKNVQAEVTVRVDRPREEVYSFWRRLENLPLFMDHLESVRTLDADGQRSRWKAKVPGGLATIEWEAQIVEDEPGKMISWRSAEDADIQNAGKVEFRTMGSNMTEIRAVISYSAPGGVVGQGLAELLTPVFEKTVKSDVKNFKEYMESRANSNAEAEPSSSR